MVVSDGEHWYPSPKKKDVWYPSVTTYLSVYPKGKGFEKYLANQTSWESSQEILEAAGSRGTRVHRSTELLEQGATLTRTDFSIDEWQMLMGFVSWRKSRPDLILLPSNSEFSIVSDTLQTGGTIDRAYGSIEDGKLHIVDIKTSNAIHGNYWVQVAVYAAMCEKKYSLPIEQVSILRLAPRKRDLYEFVTMERAEWKEELKVFKAIQEIFWSVNPNAKPKILELPTTLCL